VSSAHTIAFELSGIVDTDGVAPGKLYVVAELVVVEGLIWYVDEFKVNCCSFPWAPAR
jgi:hypothetical protein